MDNSALAEELLHGFDQRATPRRACVRDLQKAFDSVHWQAVVDTLQGMGFAHSFIDLILDCMSFSFLLEGQPTEEFQSGRGLWKDPLSPMLFNLVLESLSQAFHQVEERSELNGYKMGGVKLVSHLIFADDLLVFSKAKWRSLEAIKKVLQEFSNYLHLTPNPTKSAVIFSLSCQDDSLKKILGYSIEGLPVKHLGVPLVGRELRTSDCIALTDQLKEYFL